MSSGTWAGGGAARFATALGASALRRRLTGAGGVALRPTGGASYGGDPGAEAKDVLRRQVHPYDKNYLRHGDRLRPALDELDEVWARLRAGATAEPAATPRLRQAAAMVAHARWMYTAALARTESRGMARRQDFPGLDPAQRRRLTVGGLDEIWVRPESAARPELAVAS